VGERVPREWRAQWKAFALKVLVAFDGSEGAQAALQAAASIVREAGGQVLLLHALNPSADATGVFASSQREAVDIVVQREREALAQHAAAVSPVDTDTRVEVLDRGEDVWRGILRVADEWGADVIATASRRAAGLRGTLVGSVTTGVLQHATVPVLVVRA
jgi:nucleotide-binding universal stress UspA family protein